MAPVIDDAAGLTVGPCNDALMGADHMPLDHYHKSLRVDAQTDGLGRKAGGSAIAV